jgi:excinuclease ABC subunit C
MDKDKQKTILKNIPSQPGVYLMQNKQGTIIYVGKAKNLKNRVRSYFNPSNTNPKVKILVSKIEKIETIITSSEIEALLLEANLIKKYHPHYNVLFKDDKKYPYLKLTVSEEFPILKKVRKKPRKSKDLFWGPYPQEGILNTILETLTEIFSLRRCKNFKIRKNACLDFYIGKCLGVCLQEKQHLKDKYMENIEKIKKILSGKVDEIINEMKVQMQKEAAAENFEEAAQLRDNIFLLKKLKEKQFMENLYHREADIFQFAGEGEVTLLGIFHLRDNKILGKETLQLKITLEELKEELDSIVFNYYARKENMLPPRELVFPSGNEKIHLKTELLKEGLQRKFTAKFKVVFPQRGELYRLLKLLEHNLKLELSRIVEKKDDFQKIKTELEEILNIKNFFHIEAFDISNLGTSFPVGAVIVNKKGKFSKKDYRKFNIKTVYQQNDFAMLKEVVQRRYQRLLDERQSLPDVVLIDGGKGQLKSAYLAFESINFFPPALLSIAKREEIIYRINQNGKIEKVPLQNLSPAHKFLIRCRDEIHRFVITFHRSKRAKSHFKSILEGITGIGPQKRKMILQKFPTPISLKNATMEELQEIPGINQKLAEKIKEALEELL